MPFLSRRYNSTTPEMPLTPSDMGSGFVKENTAGRRGEVLAAQPGLNPVVIC